MRTHGAENSLFAVGHGGDAIARTPGSRNFGLRVATGLEQFAVLLDSKSGLMGRPPHGYVRFN